MAICPDNGRFARDKGSELDQVDLVHWWVKIFESDFNKFPCSLGSLGDNNKDNLANYEISVRTLPGQIHDIKFNFFLHLFLK